MRGASRACILGQESFQLRSETVELAITRIGGMLAPVTFFPASAAPIRPYAIAPWAEETLASDIPAMLRALRGDWFCSAFGENVQAHRGQRLPPHGETANREWQDIDRRETDEGAWLRLGVDLPLQGGRCRATTAVLAGHSVIYQRHDMSELPGAINPGHHATLAFADMAGAGRLSFSRWVHAQTYPEPAARPENRGYSRLKPDSIIEDFSAVPCIDGTTTSLLEYPARRGYEDIAILCADPSQHFAWSAVTFPAQRYAWFALRNPAQLVSTLLWFSNGGRHFAPWNGRHINVMGIEDITAFFHVGADASCRENALTRRGIRTCLEPDSHGALSIPYIQGVARIPEGFDRVARIEAGTKGEVRLIAQSGAIADVACEIEFLKTGRLAGLELP